MNWFWISVGSIGALLYLLGRGRRRTKRVGATPERRTKARTTPADRVQQTAASGDVGAMESLLKETDDIVLEHRLLEAIIALRYRERSDSESREAFYRFARQHIALFPQLFDALESDGQERPDRIESFKMMAIALAEEGRYKEAIDVCHTAMSFDLEDGTKTGFKGRIARLEKNMGASA